MQKSKEDNFDILKLLGVTVEDGKIELDTNKTKSFFENLQEKATKSAEDLEKGLQEGNLNLSDSVGLKVEDQKVELDLNKTKSFLESLAQKAATFLETIDKDIQNIKKEK